MCFGRSSGHDHDDQPSQPVRVVSDSEDVPLQDIETTTSDTEAQKPSSPAALETYQIDRQTLEDALTHMAGYLRSRRQAVTVITVGGIVDMFLLQSRQAITDIDFFSTNVTPEQRSLLNQAALEAEQKSPISLGWDWFNNDTTVCLPSDALHVLTEEATSQNCVVFERPGLRLLAAPWYYAMIGKMKRMMHSEHVEPSDLKDAVSYLRRHIEAHGGRRLLAAQIQVWCHWFQIDSPDHAVIRAVKKEYQAVHGTRGLV